MEVSGIRFDDPQFKAIPSAELSARAELKNQRVQSDLVLRGLTEDPLKLHLEFPLSLTLVPASWSLPARESLQGQIQGSLDLARIATFFDLDEQELSGRLDMDLAIQGTLEKPRMDGQIQLSQGSYENLRTGTLLRDMEMLMRPETGRLRIQKMQASDGEGGTVSGQGWIDMLPGSGHGFEMEILFDQVALIRQDYATAKTGGQLTFTNADREMMLEGRMTVGPAEFRIPDRLPQDITEIEVTEINGKGEKGKSIEQKKPSPGSFINLDVSLVAPGHVFIRGRGLDSEWQADLRVVGKADQPVVSGKLTVVRGNFNFMGKRFELKNGQITFDRGVPPVARIDVTAEAEARARDMTAQLRVTGTTEAPEIKLSSDPALPQDEILARLLFGRSVTQITPWQAIQLANALNTLAGGGGLDFMGRMRNMIGVDQLEIKQSEEDFSKTTIRAGKYLNERVYLEVERGLDYGSGKASVEIEITPNISVETEMGEDAEGGIGFNWRWDY